MRIRRRTYDRKYYDSPFYRASSNSQRNRLRLKEILSHKPAGRLLEIGCGRGEFLALAASRFVVEGIDHSEFAVKDAHPAVRARIRRASVEDGAFANGSYDVIVALNVLEHLPNPHGVLAGIYQHLAPDGMLFGSVPHNDRWIGRIHTSLTNYFDKTHCSTHAPRQWRRLFEQAGFRAIEFFGEVMIGPGLAIYLRRPYWRDLSFNLVFECQR